MREIIPAETNTCITCGTDLTGQYCSLCGEKKLNPATDYSIRKFLEQTVDAFSHFDSKFLRSFKALLLKPGFLTAEFIRGKRTPYMKPVQIFIVASVLFYFVYPANATFYSGIKNMTYGNILHYDVTPRLEKKVRVDSVSMRQVMESVNNEAAHKSKAFLFIIIPLLGLAYYLMFRKSISFLVPHVVFATHNLSFLILLFLAYISGALVFGHQNIGDAELMPLAIIFAFYIYIAIRRVYRQKITASLFKTVLSFFIFLLFFVIYREVITIWALST